MEEMLHEPISVDAVFDVNEAHRCIPRSFRTNTGREVFITEIGLIHPKFDGLKTHFLFDVTDGSSDYRISLDTERLEWYLEWEGDQNV
jgi:hypothetical protein